MKKFLSIFIIFSLFLSSYTITNADFFEDNLNLETHEFEIRFNFYELKNYNIQNKKYQKQYQILKKINPIIQKAIIKKYKNKEFSYYKTNALVRHYNSFIYYANKYFQSIKLEEKYGKTRASSNNIYRNFIDMKSAYYKFKNILN